LQFGGAVIPIVGATVTSGVRVSVGGTKDCFVGTRVAVTKAGPAVTAALESTSTEIQEVRSNEVRRIIFLNMVLRGMYTSIQVNR
jgi:hypothetical protein